MEKGNKPTENAEFERELLSRLQMIELRVEKLISTLVLDGKLLAAHEAGLTSLEQKMGNLYYHVFPERLEQDAKFTDQLRSLNPRDPPTGDDPEL